MSLKFDLLQIVNLRRTVTLHAMHSKVKRERLLNAHLAFSQRKGFSMNIGKGESVLLHINQLQSKKYRSNYKNKKKKKMKKKTNGEIALH